MEMKRFINLKLKTMKLKLLMVFLTLGTIGYSQTNDYENEDSITNILCNDFDSIDISKSFTSNSYDTIFNSYDYMFTMHGKYVDYYGGIYGTEPRGTGSINPISVDALVLGENINPNLSVEALIIYDADIKFDFTNYSNPSKTVSFDVNGDLGEFSFLIDGMNYLSPPSEVLINVSSLSNGIHVEVSGTFNSIVLGGWELIIDNMCVKDYASVTTGINSGKFNFDAKIYPNPTNDRVTINIDGLKENYSYQVIDLSGKQLTQGELNNPETSINFSNYAMGMYYIKILSSKNETLETFKVFKNK